MGNPEKKPNLLSIDKKKYDNDFRISSGGQLRLKIIDFLEICSKDLDENQAPCLLFDTLSAENIKSRSRGKVSCTCKVENNR